MRFAPSGIPPAHILGVRGRIIAADPPPFPGFQLPLPGPDPTCCGLPESGGGGGGGRGGGGGDGGAARGSLSARRSAQHHRRGVAHLGALRRAAPERQRASPGRRPRSPAGGSLRSARAPLLPPGAASARDRRRSLLLLLLLRSCLAPVPPSRRRLRISRSSRRNIAVATCPRPRAGCEGREGGESEQPPRPLLPSPPPPVLTSAHADTGTGTRAHACANSHDPAQRTRATVSVRPARLCPHPLPPPPEVLIRACTEGPAAQPQHEAFGARQAFDARLLDVVLSRPPLCRQRFFMPKLRLGWGGFPSPLPQSSPRHSG